MCLSLTISGSSVQTQKIEKKRLENNLFFFHVFRCQNANNKLINVKLAQTQCLFKRNKLY